MTKVHSCGAIPHLKTAGPGGCLWPFQRLSHLRGPCQYMILHRKCHVVGWVKQASVHSSQEPSVKQGHEQIICLSAKVPPLRGTLTPSPTILLSQGTTKHQAGEGTQKTISSQPQSPLCDFCLWTCHITWRQWDW